MSAETDALDNLVAKVTVLDTVVDSENTLLTGLAAQLRANANSPAAIKAIADKIDADVTKITDAIAANTV